MVDRLLPKQEEEGSRFIAAIQGVEADFGSNATIQEAEENLSYAIDDFM